MISYHTYSMYYLIIIRPTYCSYYHPNQSIKPEERFSLFRPFHFTSTQTVECCEFNIDWTTARREGWYTPLPPQLVSCIGDTLPIGHGCFYCSQLLTQTVPKLSCHSLVTSLLPALWLTRSGITVRLLWPRCRDTANSSWSSTMWPLTLSPCLAAFHPPSAG